MSDSNTAAEKDAPSAMTGPADGAATVIDEVASPLNPSDRAFWIGLAVVIASLIASLASYLILTGLTAIVPRTGVVWTALAVNVVLIIAMLTIIVWPLSGCFGSR